FFACKRARGARCWAGPWAFYKLRDDGIVRLSCPTCQNVFAGSLKASQPATIMLLCMGLFSIFWLGAKVHGLPSRSSRWLLAPPVRLRSRFAQARPDTLRPDGLRMAAPRVARQGEAWWACLDSNQEPDRYERPALTIELQAPPQTAARFEGGQRCRQRLQG